MSTERFPKSRRLPPLLRLLLRRLLKALLSLSLASATLLALLTLQRLRAPPAESGARALAPANASLAPAAWGVRVANCTADESLRAQEWFRRLEPRFQQYALHRHCRYFPMLIDHPEKCRAEDVHLLVVVKSVIEQHDRREAVRRTWGREQVARGGRRVKTLFLLGAPAAGKDRRNLQRLLEYEDRVYGDILQWDFMDTFLNLTLKEVNFLRWFAMHCARARFVFKGDDDVFVHTGNLLELIEFKAQEAAAGDAGGSLFVGDAISKAIPIRNRDSKYYIPRELFDKPYPPYAGGGGFLMSSQLARRLLAASEALELYPIDDVFLGMCLQRLRVAPELHPGFRTFGVTRRKLSPMNRDPCFFRGLIVVHRLGPEELLRMWRLVHSRELVCAKRALL